MLWLVIAILLVLAGAAAVLFVILHATEGDDAADDGAPAAPFTGRDDTPAGDTTEHAGDQTSSGETVGGHEDAEASGGTGRPEGDPTTQDRDAGPRDIEGGRGRFESGTIGGEAEAESTADVGEPPRPAR